VDDTVVRLPAVLFGRAIAGPRPQPPRQAASRSKEMLERLNGETAAE
jgi:hypothetical protein